MSKRLCCLSGIALAALSALVLIWRVDGAEFGARQRRGDPDAGAQPWSSRCHGRSRSQVRQPAATVPVAEAPKSNSADDPYGVMATLPAGASYTAIAVATAEAAARAKAASGFQFPGIEQRSA